jgi:hypothetical protein
MVREASFWADTERKIWHFGKKEHGLEVDILCDSVWFA